MSDFNRGDYYNSVELLCLFKWLSIVSLATYISQRKFPFTVYCNNGEYFAKRDEVDEYLNTDYAKSRLNKGYRCKR